MKALNHNPAKRSHERHGHRKRRTAKAVACAFAGVFALTNPLTENAVRAEEPKAEAPAPAEISIVGNRAIICKGPDENAECGVAYIVIKGLYKSILTAKGPAKFTVLFYPILRKSYRKKDVKVSYTFGMEGSAALTTVQKKEWKTSATEFSAECPDKKGVMGPCFSTAESAVWEPIELPFTVPEGKHILEFSEPNGLVELVRSEKLAEEPKTDEKTEEPDKPSQTPVVSGTEEKPGKHTQPVMSFDAEREVLKTPGPEENSGERAHWQGYGRIWFDDNWAFVLGAGSSSYKLKLETDTAHTSFRSISVDGSPGLAYWNSGHLAYAVGHFGYRAMMTDVYSLMDNRYLDEYEGQFEGGGQAGWSYRGDFQLGADVMASNNPFNPLKGQVFIVPPLEWPSYNPSSPWAKVDLLWLKSMTVDQSTGAVGAAKLSMDNFNMRALLGIPIIPLGPVVPSFIGGGELTAGDEVNGDFRLGGSLGYKAEKLLIEAGALGSTKGLSLLIGLESRL